MLGHMLAFDGVSLNGKADRAVSEYVTGNFFSLLGVKPYAGRFFLSSEGQMPGADPITVLSHGYWKTRFGGDPDIVGKRILVNAHPCTVVGIAPPEFRGLYPESAVTPGLGVLRVWPPRTRTKSALFNYGSNTCRVARVNL
jgi:hypothetical protein